MDKCKYLLCENEVRPGKTYCSPRCSAIDRTPEQWAEMRKKAAATRNANFRDEVSRMSRQELAKTWYLRGYQKARGRYNPKSFLAQLRILLVAEASRSLQG